MEEKFYTIDQVADMLGMHHKTIRKFITEGKLGANKIGKQWRITGHDLSIFMEKNNFNVNPKNTNQEQNIDFYTNEEEISNVNQKIKVSTVVDINDINIDEYMRVSNTLIAIMNCKDPKMGYSTINMKYSQEEKRLRIMLWGTLKFTEEMLNSISLLVESTNSY